MVSADPGPTAATAVGYIEQLTGHLEDFSIERRGTSIPLALLLPLQVGDRLTVQGIGNIALLQCGNRSVRVTEKESPFVVPSVSAPPNFLNRLGALLLEVGSRLTTQQARTVTKVSTSSRGENGPLAIPMLHQRTNQLPARGGTLYIGWTGGVTPYELRLVLPQAAGSQDSVTLNGLQEPRAAVGLASPLSPGFVRVEIIDGEQAHVHGTFEVVAAMPPSSSVDVALEESDLPIPLRTVMTADTWAKRSPAQWSFYAYQAVAPFGESYEPARLLRDCLEESETCHAR
jgi:hypothetical protein